MRTLLRRRLSNIRVDPYGIYFWSVRFTASLMWPVRFWGIRRQTNLPYNGGNVSFGPFYAAWYDYEATIPGSRPTNPKYASAI